MSNTATRLISKRVKDAHQTKEVEIMSRHLFLKEFPKLVDLIFFDFQRFADAIKVLTENPRLRPTTAFKIMSSFYATKATDNDFILLRDDKTPCSELEDAFYLEMNTGLITDDGDPIWIRGELNNRPFGPKKYKGYFKIKWMEIRFRKVVTGHRLLSKYQILSNFVYLYPMFLAQNLIENANARVNPDWCPEHIVTHMTITYRRLSDEHIDITRDGVPCEEEQADSIVFPTGFYDDNMRAVCIFCERSDPGKDHPWCLHRFGIREDNEELLN